MATALVIWADEPTHLLRWHLERAGFDTVAIRRHDLVNGAPGARELLDVVAPDVVVYEVQAPVAESLEFLDLVRAGPRLEGVPCVATRAPSVNLADLIAPAIAAVLTAPFDPRIATTIVRSALRFRSDTAA